jgi:poly-gamma-glutamate synthesis protein (capsule biosynthesis protein)
MLTITVTGQVLAHEPIMRWDPSSPFARLFDADASIANLECTVATEGAWPTKTKTLHLAEPETLASLHALGFTALAHANNHAFDLGPPGIATTRAAAHAAGLGITGSGDTIEEALTPAITGPANRRLVLFSVDLGPQPEINYAAARRGGIAPLRLQRTVAVSAAEYATFRKILTTLGDTGRQAARTAVGYSEKSGGAETLDVWGTPVIQGEEIASLWSVRQDDFDRLAGAMANARGAGRLVAVAIHNHHWNADWREAPEFLLEVAHRLIDAGADLVFGTGAPVLQPIRFHKGRAILPGLGNFVFHTRRAATYDEKGVDVWRSAACRVTLADDGACAAIAVLPLHAGRPPQPGEPAQPPVPLEGADRDEIWARITAGLSADQLRRVVLAD